MCLLEMDTEKCFTKIDIIYTGPSHLLHIAKVTVLVRMLFIGISVTKVIARIMFYFLKEALCF